MTIATPTPAEGRSAWDLLLAAVAAGLIVFALMLARALLSGQPAAIDYLPMWTGARLAAAEPAKLYDFAAVTTAQRWLLGPIAGMRPFPYPPSALVVLGPLARLPFWISYGAWMAAGLAAFLVASLRLAPSGRRWLAAPLLLAPAAAVVGIVAGQSVFLIGAIAMAAILILPRRPLLAGVLLGAAMAVKPTVLILVPVALIAGGHWRALLAAGVAGLLMIGVSVLAYGPGPWPAWIQALPAFQAQVLGDPLLRKCLITPTGLAAQIGLTGPLLLAWRGAFILAGIALAAAGFRLTTVPSLRLTALFGAGLLASPYAMNYDAALLLPGAVAILLAARSSRGRAVALAAFAAVVAAGFPNVGAVALMIFLALCPISMLADRRGSPA